MVNKWTIWMLMLQGLAATVVLSHQRVYAQVSFQTVSLNENAISPRTLFSMVLANTGLACDVRFDGDIRTREGGVVLSFRSDPIRIGAGSITVLSSELTMRLYEYGMTEAGRSAMKFGRLQQGDYVFCLRAEALQAESRDEYCDQVRVEDFLFLDLVDPWDGDSIDDVRPTLSWILSGSPTALTDADVRLVLVPMEKGMRAAQALARNRPLFIVPNVKEFAVAYPFGIPDLERGQCYAWQAERLEGVRVIDRSDPWGFCVREHREPLHNKYVHLDRIESGAIYEALDEMIFFRYDEPYESGKITCLIHDGKNRTVEPRVSDDRVGANASGVRSVGANLYELDLQPYGLAPGHYHLIVRDEKGRDHSLKFRVTR